MSEPIKAGDLVMVVREGMPCPAKCRLATNTLGRIFRVARVATINLVCNGCGIDKGTDVVAFPDSGTGVYRLPRLKRIPPLGELDDVKREEEIAA